MVRREVFLCLARIRALKLCPKKNSAVNNTVKRESICSCILCTVIFPKWIAKWHFILKRYHCLMMMMTFCSS